MKISVWKISISKTGYPERIGIILMRTWFYGDMALMTTDNSALEPWILWILFIWSRFGLLKMYFL